MSFEQMKLCCFFQAFWQISFLYADFGREDFVSSLSENEVEDLSFLRSRVNLSRLFQVLRLFLHTVLETIVCVCLLLKEEVQHPAPLFSRSREYEVNISEFVNFGCFL